MQYNIWCILYGVSRSRPAGAGAARDDDSDDDPLASPEAWVVCTDDAEWVRTQVMYIYI